MERINELLAKLTDDTITVEELAELNTLLCDAADDLIDAEATDEVVQSLSDIATNLEAVKAKQDAITEADEARKTAAAELADRIRAARGGDEGGDGGEGGEAPAEEADGETAPVDGKKEPIAASGVRQLRSVKAVRPKTTEPKNVADAAVPVPLLASAGDAHGLTEGALIDSPKKMADAFDHAIKMGRGYRGEPTPVNVMRSTWSLPADRVLSETDPSENARKIAAVINDKSTSWEALTAAGGICAPLQIRYDLPVIGVANRPVRDSLPRFGADRGGIRTFVPPNFNDATTGVTQWTNANDANPVSPATKPVIEVDCPADEQTYVYAITQGLKFSNFRERFFPEQIQAWMKMLDVVAARLGEQTILDTFRTHSRTRALVHNENLSATRDILAGIDKLTAGVRWYWRKGENAVLHMWIPFYVKDMIRTDLARELPGATAERLAMTDPQIEAFFNARKINVTWTLDVDSSTTAFPRQPLAGSIARWPDKVTMFAAPEGEWLFLDGGELNVGMFRDATLVGVNKVQFFAETFEAAHFTGLESYRLDMNLCPNGQTAATEDTSGLCAQGS